MLTYLRREERKPTNARRFWRSRLEGRPGFVEANELPQDFAERRLNQRVFSYWQGMRCEGSLPAPGDVDPAELGDDWAHCFILDMSADYGFSKFDYLGISLAKFSGVFLSGHNDWTRTVLDAATDQVAKVVERAGPVLCDDELTLFDGRRLLFRSVLLPLSVGGGRITHLLGAANGKLVAI
jgi:hypothetical protein